MNFSLPEKKRDESSSDTNTNYWSQTTENVPPNINVGTPIYHDKGTVNVGYDKYVTSELYSELAVLDEENTKSFGNSITCSQDGSTMAVADIGEGKIYIYLWNTNTNSWSINANLSYPSSTSRFTKVGSSASTSSFQITTSQSDSQFGYSLSLSSDGSGLFVGAPGVEVTTSSRGSENGGKGAVFYWTLKAGPNG